MVNAFAGDPPVIGVGHPDKAGHGVVDIVHEISAPVSPEQVQHRVDVHATEKFLQRNYFSFSPPAEILHWHEFSC